MASRSATVRRIHPPKWETERPFLTGSALRDCAQAKGALSGGPYLGPLPLAIQEKATVEDALFALLGVRTSFLEHYVDDEGFVLYSAATPRTEGADVHIVPLLSKVLVLANDYHMVKEFVEENRVATAAGGYVRQALGVAVAELLNEYRGFIVRLEKEHRTKSLTLQQLVYHVQPSARSMALLRQIVEAVANHRGGAALDKVYKLAASFVGAEERQDMLAFVVGRVAAPVLEMTDAWVLRGMIDDPFNEFFVGENTGASPIDATDSKFWAGRYACVDDNLPEFLAPFIEKIFRAGKYLNVLRECGVDVAPVVTSIMNEERTHHTGSSILPIMRPDMADGITHMRLSGSELLSPDTGRRIGVLVNLFFVVASRALMKHLREEVRIVARLRSIRRFFLLEEGDFLVHFFDAAHKELSKERTKVSETRLASLLELSVRTSVSASDPYHEELTCRLHMDDIATQVSKITSGVKFDREGMNRGMGVTGVGEEKAITGYDAFSFDYSCKWPLKLIISDIEMLKYQLISRYLLHCKRVENELGKCWVNHTCVKAQLAPLRMQFVRSFALRNRMLQFVRNMVYYTLADVLEPNWRKLTAAIAKAETLDEIIAHHATFLDTSLRESLVSNDKHLRTLYGITQVCLLFSAYTERICGGMNAQSDPNEILDYMKTHKYQMTVSKFETKFDVKLKTLMDGLQAMAKKRASSHLANLCDCLDTSRFYERRAIIESAAYGV